MKVNHFENYRAKNNPTLCKNGWNEKSNNPRKIEISDVTGKSTEHLRVLSFVENSHLNTFTAVQHNGLSQKLVHRILKQIRFHSYKIYLVQELKKIMKMIPTCRFFETIILQIDNNLEFISNIVFLDEPIFQLGMSTGIIADFGLARILIGC